MVFFFSMDAGNNQSTRSRGGRHQQKSGIAIEAFICFCWSARRLLILWTELSVAFTITLTVLLFTTNRWQMSDESDITAFVAACINVACSTFIFISLCANSKKMLWACLVFVIMTIINLLITCIIQLLYINGAIVGNKPYDHNHLGQMTAYTVCYYMLCILVQFTVAYTIRQCIVELDYELKQDTPTDDFS